jgi:hypothetical protein
MQVIDNVEVVRKEDNAGWSGGIPFKIWEVRKNKQLLFKLHKSSNLQNVNLGANSPRSSDISLLLDSFIITVMK